MENWRLKTLKIDTKEFIKELNISPITARVMANRGIHTLEDANMYINSDISRLRNPRKIKDIEKGAKLLKEGIQSNKKILIVGDYDVDGVISSYVLYTGLKRCSADVTYHIPDRIIDGYGINESIIRNAKNNNVDIIITCDNGIAAIEQIALAKELGITVIITDHHDVPYIELENGEKEYTLPPADAVINPKQNDCKYEFDRLCGAGVAFKFIQVLYEEMNINIKEAEKLIQFVAIATVCDVVDLIDENRIIVKKGLEQLNNTDNLGLSYLIEETGLKDREIAVYALGFVIGPCINASGRLDYAGVALDLLLTENKDEAKELAVKLNLLNEERQKLTKEGLEASIHQIQANNMTQDKKVLVVYMPNIHESIAGIIAGRVREKFNLPAIVLTKAHDGAKGSGRSIEEYNMFEELVKCKDLLGKFGGHPMAAGMSIPTENIDTFRNLINQNCTLTDEDIIPKVFIDVPLNISNISYELIKELKLLEPFGKANAKPTFGAKNLRVKQLRILGKNKNVLKLTLQENDIYIDAIYFGDIEKFVETFIDKYGEQEYEKTSIGRGSMASIDLVYYPEINEFRGQKSIQLNVSNYRL